MHEYTPRTYPQRGTSAKVKEEMAAKVQIAGGDGCARVALLDWWGKIKNALVYTNASLLQIECAQASAKVY